MHAALPLLLPLQLQALQSWPCHVGLPHDGLRQALTAPRGTRATSPFGRQAALQYVKGSPYGVGLPHPGRKQVGTLHARLQYSLRWPFHVGFPQPGFRQTTSSEEDEEVSPEAAEDAAVEQLDIDVMSPHVLWPPPLLRWKIAQPGCAQMNCLCEAGSGCAALHSTGQREL